MALAFRQTTTANGTASPLAATAFTSSPTVGQLIVLTIADDSGATGTITGVTDNAGNTYTKDYNASDAASLSIYHTVITATTASLVVTITFSGALRVSAAIQEFSGFTGTPTRDILGVGVDATATSVASQSKTPTQANEIVIGSSNHTGATAAFSLGSGYTNLGTVNVANAAVAQESKIISVVAAQQATFTIASALESLTNIISFYDSANVTASNQFFF